MQAAETQAIRQTEAAQSQEKAAVPQPQTGTTTTKTNSGHKMPLSLDQLDQQTLNDGEQAVSEATPQDIDAAIFVRALDALLQELEATRPTVVAFLRRKNYSLQHNCWVQPVATQHELNLLHDARDSITAQMRQACNNPSIYIKAVLDENLAPQTNEAVPLTEKEKLAMLVGRNPHLEQFMETFNTLLGGG